MEPIRRITEFRGDYYFLSNFYSTTVSYDGLTFKSSEAAFQAQKCIAEEQKKVFTELTASASKKLGRKVSLRQDWDEVKDALMKDIVRAKFDQHLDLKKMLINTGNSVLEEGNTWGDKYWGIDSRTGKGENHLGRILMELRSEFLYSH